jgi:hypothetical protein
MDHHRTFDAQTRRKRNLECVPFRLRRDRRKERYAENAIECCRGQDERRAPFQLLAPGLRLEVEDDQVTPIGRQSNTSFPTGAPPPISVSGSRTVANHAASRVPCRRSTATP